MLVSGVKQSESIMHIHISSLFLDSFPHYRILHCIPHSILWSLFFFFFFDVMVSGIVSFISLSDILLLVYRNARDFCEHYQIH